MAGNEKPSGVRESQAQEVSTLRIKIADAKRRVERAPDGSIAERTAKALLARLEGQLRILLGG